VTVAPAILEEPIDAIDERHPAAQDGHVTFLKHVEATEIAEQQAGIGAHNLSRELTQR
jgi:hypothetical protein